MLPLIPLLALADPAPLRVDPFEPVPALVPASAPAPALADDMPSLEYTYVELDYVWTDSDDLDQNLQGLELVGSLELPLNFFVQGVASRKSDDADVTDFRIGAGYHIGIIPRIDVYGILSYAYTDVDDSGADGSEDGIAGELGLRFLLTSTVELEGHAKWVDVEESDFGVGGGARFYLTDMVSLGGRVDVLDEDLSFAVGARLEL